MKMGCEIQNICVNLLERCRDYKCKSLFADEVRRSEFLNFYGPGISLPLGLRLVLVFLYEHTGCRTCEVNCNLTCTYGKNESF